MHRPWAPAVRNPFQDELFGHLAKSTSQCAPDVWSFTLVQFLSYPQQEAFRNDERHCASVSFPSEAHHVHLPARSIDATESWQRKAKDLHLRDTRALLLLLLHQLVLLAHPRFWKPTCSTKTHKFRIPVRWIAWLQSSNARDDGVGCWAWWQSHAARDPATTNIESVPLGPQQRCHEMAELERPRRGQFPCSVTGLHSIVARSNDPISELLRVEPTIVVLVHGCEELH
mmetsp:Transcript_29290/g.77414  ORF Transcript_29290/g.77414 Transcript_29290/m.77414 type:complete len:228 (+) Transcript_29290:498-1181(+)